MSQPQFAAEAGVDIDTFRRIEQGKRTDPSVFNVAAIASALHLSVDKLLAEAMGGGRGRRG